MKKSDGTFSPVVIFKRSETEISYYFSWFHKCKKHQLTSRSTVSQADAWNTLLAAIKKEKCPCLEKA